MLLSKSSWIILISVLIDIGLCSFRRCVKKDHSLFSLQISPVSINQPPLISRHRGDFHTRSLKALERAIVLKEKGYTFRILVFGWRRLASLQRLLSSLLRSEYLGFNVNLDIHLDGDASPKVIGYCNDINWIHGEKQVMTRESRMGLERAIMESWKAETDTEFAFFFEDDIEVSPRFFEYSISALEKYILPNGIRARETIHTKRLFEISLYTPRFFEVGPKPVDWLPTDVIDQSDYQFLFHIPCSWGSLVFPWHWRDFYEFYLWRRDKSSRELRASIPDSAIKYWNRSWKKFLIEFMYMRGLFVLYPNLPRQISFSTHHREPGEHTNSKPQEHLVDELGTVVMLYFTVPLVEREEHEHHFDRLIAEMKPLRDLPILSFHHERVRDVHALSQLGVFTVELMEKHGWNHTKYRNNPKCVLDDVTFPVTKPNDEEKYLLYEPQLSFGHQLNALKNAAAYAKILNRTLIVPPIVAPKDDSVYIDFNRIIHVDGGFVRMIPMEQFPMFHDGWIDRIIQFLPWDVRGRMSMKLKDDLLTQYGLIPGNQAILHTFPVTEDDISNQFSGCRDKVLAFRHLFGSFSSFNNRDLQGQYDQWIKKIKSSEGVRRLTDHILLRLGKPFICVEFGRGEKCGEDIKSIDSLEQSEILKLNCESNLQETLSTSLAYATDSTLDISSSKPAIYVILSKDNDLPKKEIPVPLFSKDDILNISIPELKGVPDLIMLEVIQMIEGEICTRADYFVGNVYSSTSQRIISKRGESSPYRYLGKKQ